MTVHLASVELLRRFAAGDEHAFSAITTVADRPSGSTGTAAGSSSVSPLPVRPPEQRAGGSTSTARGGPTTPAA